MLFWKSKKNCWEFMECERGPGGSKADSLGLCPAALNKDIHREDGENSRHQNRLSTEATEKKQLTCLECNFFQQTMQEAGSPIKLRSPNNNRDSTIIRTRMTILALLRQSYQSNVQFSVSTNGNPSYFKSSLIGIDPETNVLTLDAPGVAAGQLCSNKNLNLSGQLHESEFRFTTTLFGADEKDSTTFYMVKLPHFVYHPQIRRAYRIHIDNEQHSFQAHHSSCNHRLNGHLTDISIDGIGAILNHRGLLHQGDILENCTFKLPSGEKIPAAIEVCNISHTPQQDTMRIGGHFYDITKANQQRLGQFINKAQQDAATRLN